MLDDRSSAPTYWLTQDQIALLFDVQKAAISKHVKNIFESGELEYKATVSKMETVERKERIRLKEILNITYKKTFF